MRQSASPGRNVVHCTRARVRTYLPNLSLRTSAHTGAAIRVPAEKPGNLVLLRANSYALFRIRPKYCFLFCTAARSTDCHVASLLAMTCRNLPRVRIIPGHCRHTAGKPPCTRKSASSFCIPLRQTLLQPQHLTSFCMSLRTSAHTGVAIRFPAGKLGRLAIPRANS